MTYEEAIKHFESLQKRYTTEHNGKMCEKVALALKAMEKQIAKKPTLHEYIITLPFLGDKQEFDFLCVSCGCAVYSDDNCCPNCGQAIDWSGDNER